MTNPINSRCVVPMLLCAAAMIAPAAPARGHGLHVFAEAEGAQVAGMVYFAGGGRAVDVPVTLTDDDGATVATGRTDDRGQFEFAAPAAGTYRVVADLGDGHRAECDVEVVSAAGPSDDSAAELRERIRARGRRARGRSANAIKVMAGVACISALFALLWYRQRRRQGERGSGEGE